jgi:hypothetical protein
MSGIVWEIDDPSVAQLSSVREFASITPIKEGSATITVSHPLSTNNVTMQVNVSEFYEFSFARSTVTIEELENKFVAMNYPSYSTVPSSITYESSNPAILTVRGSLDSIELTGIAPGSALVTATSNLGHYAEMLVRVEEKPADEDTEIYIACNKNSQIFEEGDETVSWAATLVGGSALDQQGLVWTSSDPTVVSVLGTGPSVQITPNKPGNVIITISHPMSDYDHSIYTEVKGVTYTITLDKVYALVKQNETFLLNAELDNAPSSAYENIVWTSSDPNIAKVVGYGKEVTVVGVSGGTAYITGQYPEGNIRMCEVDVDPTPYIAFNSSSNLSIAPGQSITVGYTHNPPYELPTFESSDPTVISFTIDYDNSLIRLYGNDYGTVNITGEILGAQSSISATCQETYSMSASIESISGEPREIQFDYDVYPSTATPIVTSADTGIATVSVDEVNKKITLTPTGTGDTHLTLRNQTAVINIPVSFSAPPVSFSLVLDSDNPSTQSSSYISGDTIVLYSGEKVYYDLVPSNQWSDVSIQSIAIVSSSGTSTYMNYPKNQSLIYFAATSVKTNQSAHPHVIIGTGSNTRIKTTTVATIGNNPPDVLTTVIPDTFGLDFDSYTLQKLIYTSNRSDFSSPSYKGAYIDNTTKTISSAYKVAVTYKEDGVSKVKYFPVTIVLKSDCPLE